MRVEQQDLVAASDYNIEISEADIAESTAFLNAEIVKQFRDALEDQRRGWFARWLDRTFDYFDIKNPAGDVYMRRYYLTPRSWRPIGRLVLHEIRRSDDDRCMHDHPFRFITLILRAYREVLRDDGTYQDRPAGTLLYRKAEFKHRVELLPRRNGRRPRAAWSLVWFGPRVRPWGFWTKRGWRQYVPGTAGDICEGQG